MAELEAKIMCIDQDSQSAPFNLILNTLSRI